MVETNLLINKKKFDDHIQKKIDKLGERARYINYKFEDVRYYFKKYSITIIYLATLLTLIEALINSFEIEEIGNIIVINIIRFIPLLLSSSISLLAALIKFNKYEDKIENITRTTEKCIVTMSKLKNIKEQLYFSSSNKKIYKLITIFLNNIYADYLESNKNIEKELIDTDYVLYMKKVADNDIKRNEIMLYKSLNINNKLDNTKNKKVIENTKNTKKIKNIKDILNYIKTNRRNNKKNYTRNYTRNNTFAKSSHADSELQNNYDKYIPRTLTSENIRNSTNSIVIDIKEEENSDDDKSLDYSQFAPSSKETDDRSFVGSLCSFMDSDNSNSTTSKSPTSKRINNNETRKNAANYIQNIWKKYKYKINNSNI
uniref:Uncharacterized protein n=1 Tax=viral metagenome TaxID=1070528 RepID=A0A6C0AZ20_9ZZZZ|tara:strand:+ start:55966 stop:57081 length:1116 start_codon:yes stop_codon:yes gene_type:complete